MDFFLSERKDGDFTAGMTMNLLELAGKDGLVLATGSLYFIGALRDELGLAP